MEISKKTAMMIVQELKNIINHDLTFMDRSSHIIACTNETRIGSYHAATCKMLTEHLQTLIVYSDDEYEGTLKGLNTVIEIDDQVVAVVGATGDWKVIEKYVQIIKKMTEILLLEELYNNRKRTVQDAKSRFIHEWVFGQSNWLTNDFYSRGMELGIDISLSRRVVLISCTHRNETGGHSAYEDKWETILPLIKESFYKDTQTLWIISGYRLVLLMGENNDKNIERILKRMKKQALDRHGISMFFGIDSMPTWSEFTRVGYQRADKALLSSRSNKSSGISYYRDIDVEVFLNEISHATKQEYLSKIFKDCTSQEIERWCQILEVLYQNNGSINKTSEQLFLHKNTLQYQLKKLQKISGYDARLIGETSNLYFAMLIWQNLDNRIPAADGEARAEKP